METNTRQAAEIAGLTYRQVEYLTKRGIIQPSGDYGQGKARVFSFRDLVRLKLAARLRSDGFGLDAIGEALRVLDTNWKSDEPEDAGRLLVLNGGVLFAWSPSDEQFFLEGAPVYSGDVRGLFYNVTRIAVGVQNETTP